MKPPSEPLDSDLRIHHYLLLCLITVIASYVIHFGLLAFLIGPFDYDHLSGYYELAWKFWMSSAGVPQYNPFLCGGRTLGADPQLPIFHPLLPLVPVLGATVLIKWEMLAQLCFGVVGLWKTLDYLGATPTGRLWGVFLYLAGGGVVARFMVGHITLGFYFLFPLFLYLSYRLSETESSHHRKWLASYWLLFVYCGMYKPNFLIYAVPVLLIEVATRALLKNQIRLLAYFCLGVSFSGLINAVTFLPAWKYFSDFPRLDASEPVFYPLYSFAVNLLLPLKAIPKAWYGPGFLQRHEYNLFLGPVALYFAWRGWKLAPASRRSECAALVFFSAMSLWIGLGTDGRTISALTPFSWFHSFWPGFASIRVPPRFWYGMFLGLVIFSSLGFHSPRRKLEWGILFAFAILPLLGNATINLAKASVLAGQTEWVAPRRYPSEIRQVHTHPDFSYRYLREGVGVLDCVENIQIDKAKSIHEGNTLSIDGGSGEARWLSWNRVAIQANGRAPLRLSLNLNQFPYWKFVGNDAHVVKSEDSRLTLESSGPEIAGELVFEQPLAREAVWVSAVALLVFLFTLFFLIHSSRRLS